MACKGGRPLDPVWSHFIKITEGNKVAAECKTCGRRQSNKAGRMKQHIKRCTPADNQASNSTSVEPSDASARGKF